MNMRTYVALVKSTENDINKVIEEQQQKGWYLRGVPQVHPTRGMCVLTFETPEADEDGSASEAGIPVELPLDVKVPNLT